MQGFYRGNRSPKVLFTGESLELQDLKRFVNGHELLISGVVVDEARVVVLVLQRKSKTSPSHRVNSRTSDHA
jgi:hypothetical protein